MDTKNFVESVRKTSLPCVYSGERLNDAKCQKLLMKIGVDTGVLAVFLDDGFGAEGFAILESGIKFAMASASTGDMKLPKMKGEFPFDKFTIHEVTVKEGTFILDVTMLMWDIDKRKSFTFQFKFGFTESAITEEITREFANLLLSLKTEAKGVSQEGSHEQVKNPNEFVFTLGDSKTTFTLNENNIVIRNVKVDEKTKNETPKGASVTISRSAIDKIKIQRAFNPKMFLGGIVGGAVIGGICATIFGKAGIFVFLILTVLGLVTAFPKRMVLYRKDGSKYKTVIDGNETEYERFINMLFK